MNGTAKALIVAMTAAVCCGPASAQRCEITCRAFDGGAAMKTFCTRDLTPASCSRHSQTIGVRNHASCQSLWRDHCRFSAEPYRHSLSGSR